MVDAVTCEGKRKLTGYNSPAKCSSSFFIFFLFCFCKKKKRQSIESCMLRCLICYMRFYGGWRKNVVHTVSVLFQPPLFWLVEGLAVTIQFRLFSFIAREVSGQVVFFLHRPNKKLPCCNMCATTLGTGRREIVEIASVLSQPVFSWLFRQSS